jgi:IS66 C-terminal element
LEATFCWHRRNFALGQVAAVFFSMTASSKRHGIDPFRYLADALRWLPTTPPDHLTELLPHEWFKTHPPGS